MSDLIPIQQARTKREQLEFELECMKTAYIKIKAAWFESLDHVEDLKTVISLLTKETERLRFRLKEASDVRDS